MMHQLCVKHIQDRDEEIAQLRRQLDATAKDLKKVSDHSKHQSQELFRLKVSAQVQCNGKDSFNKDLCHITSMHLMLLTGNGIVYPQL